jgi:ABC-2 type transport system ATP-binding protein
MSAIEFRGISKRFGEVQALNGLDLTIEEGEIFGFLGPNGAGKSTAINILLDFVRPTSGDASVLGLDPQTESTKVRERTGVLPDGYHIYDRLTGRQHVEFAIQSKDTTDDAEAILERVGIEDAADRKAGGYSKGMTQRLVLGMALVGQPDLLILDEPTNGLDPNGAREIRDIIREERDRGATVFFSSHILEQVEAVCDRVAILSGGDVVAVDTIDGLREKMDTDSTLTVTLDRPFGDDSGRLEALDGVSGVTVADNRLSVSCADAAKIRVLLELDELGYGVPNFDTGETSLEELFVELTHGGRDADVETAGLVEESEVAQ